MGAAHALLPDSALSLQGESGEDRLTEFLDQNGLSRLAILQTERILARTIDRAARVEIAKDLANRYRQYFFSNPADASAAELIEQAQWLSKSYPDIDSPSLRLAVLHARYVIVERELRNWWRSSADKKKLGPLNRTLKVLERDIASHLRSDQNRQNELIADVALDRISQSQQQQQVHEIEVRLLHGHYLFAWTNYFLSVHANELSVALLSQAKSSFRRSLRIEQPGPIEKIDAKWLDFNAPMSGRALLGLARVHIALEENQSAQFCLQQAANLVQTKFNQPEFEFEALVFAKKWQQAVSFVHAQQSLIAPQDRVSFWQTVTHAGYSHDDDLFHARQLRQAGLRGLASEFALDELQNFSTTEQIDFAPESIDARWIKLLVRFHTLDRNRLSLEPCLPEVVDLLEQIDKQPRHPSMPSMVYLASLIQFKMGDFAGAENQLESLPQASLKSNRKLSEMSAWLKVLIQFTDCRPQARTHWTRTCHHRRVHSRTSRVQLLSKGTIRTNQAGKFRESCR